ncbi:hypothetical protein ACLMJK_000826 [Lecanora helva]
MASKAQTPMAAAARRNIARATPPIQTSRDTDRNPRFSYQDTPVEIERSTFEPYHQFSSPTNSSIDESPVTPASPSRGLPAYLQESERTLNVPLPSEKNEVQSPQEVHPAFFAPYGTDSRQQQQQQQQQQQHLQQPPVPNESLSHGSAVEKKKDRPVQPAAMPVKDTFDPPPTSAIERRGTYNPDSLSGPNGAPVDNHRPGQVSHPNASVEPHWKYGLCEPDALCCMGLFCPCIVYGKTSYRLSRRMQKQDPTDLLGYESCNGSCGLFAVVCGFQWILAAIHRTRIRKLYNLDGSFGTDCVKGLCCCCCVVMQNEREIRHREELIRKHAGPASGGYVAPGDMVYAPPPR